MDPYSDLRSIVANTMVTWRSGAVTLNRATTAAPAAAPAAETPWTPGAATTTDYDLNAVVKGAAEYADGTTVVATDLLVVASPIARLAGVATAVAPTMSDTIQIDGSEPKAIKKIQQSPASGDAAIFRIFIAS